MFSSYMAEELTSKAAQRARDVFNKGFAAIERGNFDYAIELLSSCVEQDPSFHQARKYLRAAEIQRFRKNKGGAMTHVMSMLTGIPSILGVRAMLKSGKAGQALSQAERLLRDDPLNMRFIKLFVEAALAADMPEAAIPTLEYAREQNPADIWTLNWLGTLYQKVGRTSSAKECFEKLCEVCPNDPAALKQLKDAMAQDTISTKWSQVESGGTYRDAMKDVKEAELLEQKDKAVKTERDLDALIDETRKKIEVEPANMKNYRTLAKLQSERLLFDDAIATLNRAIELNPGDPELDAALAHVRTEHFDARVAGLNEAGKAQEAADLQYERNQFVFDNLQERVRRYPNDLKLRYEYGVMLFENEYINEAIQQLQMAQRSLKHRVLALYYLALCLKAKKQYDMAVEQLEKAASEVYSMDETKKNIYYELGQVMELMGDGLKALDYFKEIYQVDIGFKDVSARVEKAYKAGGRTGS